MENSVLTMEGICKSFPGVKALDNINFSLKRGEVHALLGENGAGKSTLMKILSGVYKPDAGRILVKGEEKKINNTKDAQHNGISIIHQELNLCWNLTVAENIYLGEEKEKSLGILDNKHINQKTLELLKRIGADHVFPEEKIKDLSVAEKQMVEIAKALSYNSDVLIMDEPTSSLTDKEVSILFNTIETLKADGVSIVYISHKLEEIFKICDEITVIRDGQYVGDVSAADADNDTLIKMMVGRELGYLYPDKTGADVSEEVVLSVKDLNKEGLVNNVSFELKKGEILGFSGLVGAGRTETAKTIFGRLKKDGGSIVIDGYEVDIDCPASAISNGIAFVTEDRANEGLIKPLTIRENVTSSNLKLISNKFGYLNMAKETDLAKKSMKKLTVKAPNENTIIKTLSGGNQQKVIIGKWLMGEPKILILDEPTRGIDVGAKSEIYSIMRDLTQKGMSIIMISSELPEIIGMSDRVAVMKGGSIMNILESDDITQEKIMYYSTLEKKQD